MNADRLLAHYERIADAPDAIARLRRFILDLAVRGKLVEQDPEDESAAELLKQIEAEKARLVKEGKIRKPKTLPPIQSRGLPVKSTSGWIWTQLGDASTLITKGSTPTSYGHVYTDGGINFIKIEAIKDGELRPENVTSHISERTHDYLARSKLVEGDILFSIAGSIGTCAIVSDEILPANTNQALSIIRGTNQVFFSQFLLLCLHSSVAQFIHAKARGGAMNNISLGDVASFVIPLPPLAEQHRIVAKVDELMALCDRLEARRAEREATRGRMAAASLVRLNDPDPDPVVFRNHAAFVLENLTPFTTRTDQIKALRQTILNLAVRGKLVEQDPNDESASVLLKRIAAEKARLVKSGEVKKPKVLPDMLDDEPPFPLPPKWQWSQIAEIGVINPRNDAREDLTASFVPMRMIPAEYGLENQHHLRSWAEIRKGYTHFAEGDVGLAKITPCFENGKSTVFRELTGGLGSGTTELHIVRPLFVNPAYIIVFLKCPHFIETGIPRMTGTAGQKRVPIEYFANSPFPLPPLTEQQRIVAKVDELMALCDRLDANLATGVDTRRRLLDALLHEVLVMGADRKSVA